MFTLTALVSNLLIVAAFPILSATFAMLLLDHYWGSISSRMTSAVTR